MAVSVILINTTYLMMVDFIAVSEMRQTRSKSKHLVGVNALEPDKQSNCEQHFRPYPVLFKLGEFCIKI